MSDTLRRWIFAKPLSAGLIGPSQFELREDPIPVLKEGEALAKILLINIHSATRMRMATGATRLGETDLTNYGCARIVRSRDPSFREGDVIYCQAGWQDFQIVSSSAPAIAYPPASALVKALHGTNSQWTYAFRPVLVEMWSPSVLMEMLGTSGLTAYFGMRECGPLMPADHVAIAGTSGSVGSIAAQLAKIAGSRVIGFAGGAERCAWVVETLGINGCIDYRATDLPKQIRRAFPEGIDVYSDGVGGPVTDAVVARMNRNGRMVSFGAAASLYGDAVEMNGQAPSFRRMVGITDAIEAILQQRNIKSEAWIVDAFYHERLRAEDDLSRLMLMGRLKPVTHVVDGFEKLPAAITGLYQAGRSGKLQVQFAEL